MHLTSCSAFIYISIVSIWHTHIIFISVYLSSNLLWHDHVMNIAKQASKKLGLLYRCKSFFNAQQLCLIYKSFIRPCMEYNICHVWGAAAKTILDLLDRVQNQAIRPINDSGITNKLDSLKHRRDVADLMIFYKYSYGHCSKEVSKIILRAKNAYVKQGQELPPTVEQ